ncbi:MAG: ribosomal protein S18-alanine N-acetyltransferase [Chloroflexi bacterium]|nr:ribosomal protein S18-alanine N-acetyltransferase [Chloroflexota bacterium]
MDMLLPGKPEDPSGLIKIRKMTLGDLDQVVAIDQLSFSLPWPARSFRFELTDNPASRCWVAELDGRVVGMIVSWFIVDEIHIATFATHPDFRRQGIAKSLLLHTLRSAKEEGAIKSFLEVRENNTAALKMYRDFGYVESGRRTGYYKDNNEDAILMNLDSLDSPDSLNR